MPVLGGWGDRIGRLLLVVANLTSGQVFFFFNPLPPKKVEFLQIILIPDPKFYICFSWFRNRQKECSPGNGESSMSHSIDNLPYSHSIVWPQQQWCWSSPDLCSCGCCAVSAMWTCMFQSRNAGALSLAFQTVSPPNTMRNSKNNNQSRWPASRKSVQEWVSRI